MSVVRRLSRDDLLIRRACPLWVPMLCGEEGETACWPCGIGIDDCDELPDDEASPKAPVVAAKRTGEPGLRANAGGGRTDDGVAGRSLSSVIAKVGVVQRGDRRCAANGERRSL